MNTTDTEENDFQELNYVPFTYKNKTFYEVKNIDNSQLVYKNAVVYCPYGLDFDFEKYNIKLMLDMKQLNSIDIHNFIKKVELRNAKFLELDEKLYKTSFSIRRNSNYPIIKALIHTKDKKPFINIEYSNTEDHLKTIFDFPKKCKIKCDLIMGKIWTKDRAKKDKAGMTIYINNIKVIDY